MPPDELRTRVLPDDPAVWLAAADLLFAAPEDAPRRRAYVRAAADRWRAGPGPATPDGWLDWGRADEELGDDAAALAVWRQAAERFPQSDAIRDRLAARLEADEEYAAALPLLADLRAPTPRGGTSATASTPCGTR